MKQSEAIAKREGVPVGVASWAKGSEGSPQKCRDIMTKEPYCCVPEDTAAQAARLMKRHDIGILPVVEDRVTRKLLGAVTDRDLTLKVVARGLDATEIPVKLVMSKPAIYCSPNDNWQTALDIMEEHLIRRVLVADDSGRLVGVIAESDVALRLHDLQKTGELVAAVSQPDQARN